MFFKVTLTHWWLGVAAYERSSTDKHLEELEDPQNITENEVKVVTRQDYINRLREFKDDLVRAWNASDRVTSLKISVKVSIT